MFCASSEVDFRATFKECFNEKARAFPVVYARVNAATKFSDDFNIHLNILQYETTLKLKCLGDRVDQTVDPYKLAKELEEHIRFRDNRVGISVLAIDRIHKLTPAQLNMLFMFFNHGRFPFSTLFIIPEGEWNRVNNFNFYKMVESMDTSFRSLIDIENFFKERSEGIVFDNNGNFVNDTSWDR